MRQNNANLGTILNPVSAFRSVTEALTTNMHNGITTADFFNMNSQMLAIMLESHLGQHENLLQNLLGPYDRDATMQLIYTMIYFASNKLLFLTRHVSRSIIELLLLEENLSVLRYLLSIKGPTTESLAENLFDVAVETQNLSAIKIIFHVRLDIDRSKVSDYYFTPLEYALRMENIELVRVLLSAGAQVNATFSTRTCGIKTPLQLAISTGKRELINILLVAGAKADVEDEDEGSALHIAARHGNIEVVQLLISAGADVNSMTEYGWTALHEAVEYGDITIVKLLISAEADIDVEDEKVLELAAGTGSAELVLFLLDAGAQNMGSAVMEAASRNDMEMVKILLDAGADIDCFSDDLKTPLTVAILKGYDELAIYLLRAGADANGRKLVVDDKQVTPLQAAVHQDKTKLARILLEAGADVNSPAPIDILHDNYPYSVDFTEVPSGNIYFTGTALQIAIYRRNHKLVKTLLHAGADINAAASEYYGRTALQAAVKGRQL